MKIFIGVGHGGRDSGALGFVKESQANLNMALGMKKELERHGVTVGISRTSDKSDPLTEKIRRANRFLPDAAIEIHNNAGKGEGFEAYVQTNRWGKDSRRLASCIEARVKEHGQKSRGIKTKKNCFGSDYFGWLRKVKAPSILCEGFFVDNEKDFSKFDTPEKQKEYGKVYAWGVLDYLGIPVLQEETPKDYFTVQAGSFRQESNAVRMKMSLQDKGFDAFILNQKQTQLNRVCIGKFSTREQAGWEQQELKSQGYSAFIKRIKEEL